MTAAALSAPNKDGCIKRIGEGCEGHDEKGWKQQQLLCAFKAAVDEVQHSCSDTSSRLFVVLCPTPDDVDDTVALIFLDQLDRAAAAGGTVTCQDFLSSRMEAPGEPETVMCIVVNKDNVATAAELLHRNLQLEETTFDDCLREDRDDLRKLLPSEQQ